MGQSNDKAGWLACSGPLIAKLEVAWASGGRTVWNETGCEALVTFCSDMFAKADRAGVPKDSVYGPGWDASWRMIGSHLILRAMLRMPGEIEADEGKALANLMRAAAKGLDAKARKRHLSLVS